jgi:predicted Na+-dependent transporter
MSFLQTPYAYAIIIGFLLAPRLAMIILFWVADLWTTSSPLLTCLGGFLIPRVTMSLLIMRDHYKTDQALCVGLLVIGALLDLYTGQQVQTRARKPRKGRTS